VAHVIGLPSGDITNRACVDDLPETPQVHQVDNARFFDEALPGRDFPLESPGGAPKVGILGVDTPLVAGLPPLVP
jgi:hypothetical protein